MQGQGPSRHIGRNLVIVVRCPFNCKPPKAWHAPRIQPYEAKRRSAPAFDRLYRYDDYEHLARIREWLTQETEEEPR